MKNLKYLSNRFLLEKTKSLAAEERRLTTEVLWHLAEINQRRLYADMGFNSLFEYAVQELGYSEAAAGRRIAAMKLLVDIPEIEPELKNGTLHLSTLSTVQYFIQKKETPTSREEKRELVLSLQGKSRRECEKELLVKASQLGISVPMSRFHEREKVVTPTLTEIKFLADESLIEKLKRIRELDAHVSAGASYLKTAPHPHPKFHSLRRRSWNEPRPNQHHRKLWREKSLRNSKEGFGSETTENALTSQLTAGDANRGTRSRSIMCGQSLKTAPRMQKTSGFFAELTISKKRSSNWAKTPFFHS